MNLRTLLLIPILGFALLNLACLRTYNVSPVTSVTLGAPVPAPEGLELKSHAFLKSEEIQEKFGEKLAKDRQVIPVQIALKNTGTQVYKITRASFVLQSKGGVKVDALSTEQAYQLGRHGWGEPICGLIFGGILGIPSAYTTSKANDLLAADYKAKMLNDSLLEPGKEASGVLFFDPFTVKLLSRTDKFTLVLELENASTGAKTMLEQPLG